MRDTTTKSYPTIAQGFGIVGLFILLSISQSPFYMLLSNVVDKELSMLVFYVIVTATISGLPVYTRKSSRVRVLLLTCISVIGRYFLLLSLEN